MLGKDAAGVVVHDAALRESLLGSIGSVDIEARGYASANAFLEDTFSRTASCVLLDLHLPEPGGLVLQRLMRAAGMTAPVLFVGAPTSLAVVIPALREGALDFVQKPVDERLLLARVRHAIERGRELRRQSRQREFAAARLATLSPRESEVLALLLAGKINKVIAGELGLSAKTVEDHRASIMRKTRARSLAELVWLVVASQSPKWWSVNPFQVASLAHGDSYPENPGFSNCM